MKYLPETPRVYKSTAKNAQEAHEAIRPTDMDRRPQDVARYLDPDEQRLYELIWKRTLASQMESAVLDQVAVDISGAGRGVTLRANGSVVVFDGFLALWRTATIQPRTGDRHAPAEHDGRLGGPRESVTPNSISPSRRRLFRSSLVAAGGLGIGRRLRFDPASAAGPQVRAHGQAARHPRGSRPSRHGLPHQLLRALFRL
jgi:DNA topoisomerase-1